MWNNSVLVGLQCTEMTVLPVTVIMVIDIDEMISSSCLLCVAELFGRSSDNTTSQDVVHHSETVWARGAFWCSAGWRRRRHRSTCDSQGGECRARWRSEGGSSAAAGSCNAIMPFNIIYAAIYTRVLVTVSNCLETWRTWKCQWIWQIVWLSFLHLKLFVSAVYVIRRLTFWSVELVCELYVTEAVCQFSLTFLPVLANFSLTVVSHRTDRYGQSAVHDGPPRGRVWWNVAQQNTKGFIG